MRARRPERSGSQGAAGAGAARAAATGLLLGGACLLLALPSRGRAEAAAGGPSAVRAASPAGSGRRAPDSASVAAGAGGRATERAKPVPPAGAESAARPAPAAPARKPATTPGGSAPPAKASALSPRSAAVAPTIAAGPRLGKGGPAAAGRRPATLPSVRPAASGVVRAQGVHAAAHLEQKLTYQYNALGRRDPFQPMVGGEFVGADVGGDAPVDVGGMKVVGIVWGTEDKFAMVEDGRGQSLVLRVGDKVMNGVVTGLRRDAVLVRYSSEGQTQTVAIPLTRKGDKSNATR